MVTANLVMDPRTAPPVGSNSSTSKHSSFNLVSMSFEIGISIKRLAYDTVEMTRLEILVFLNYAISHLFVLKLQHALASSKVLTTDGLFVC